MPLFPVFIKLGGRRCLVVGAGPVGESKIAGLLSAGAAVVVVAPIATERVRQWARQGVLEWKERPFEPRDLEQAALVVAAVPQDVAESVFAAARARGILCNSVDDPERCDFYYPAVVTRGAFQIAISTAGHSPALAQRVRRELERQFGPEYAEWVEQLGAARRELFSSELDAGSRRDELHRLAAAAPPTQDGAHHDKTADAEPGRSRRGHVFLVGAGPGDPELLTLKALRVLGQADVVLHDDLLTPEILELVPSGARVERVGKRHNEPRVSQDEINRRLCRYAAAGEIVVRLKGGDGAIFGRAGEELDALRAAGVAFTIVPGVTAASGAAASAGVSLTDRRLGSALVFVTAQRCKGNPPPDWAAITRLGGAMAIYMPGGHEAELARELMVAGVAPATPCFVVSQASRSDERVVQTTVAGLPRERQLPAPALLLIGVLPPPAGALPGHRTASEADAAAAVEDDA